MLYCQNYRKENLLKTGSTHYYQVFGYQSQMFYNDILILNFHFINVTLFLQNGFNNWENLI